MISSLLKRLLAEVDPFRVILLSFGGGRDLKKVGMIVELMDHAPLPLEKSKNIRSASNSSKRSVTNREIVTHRTDGG
jgi:hypothetical protein